MAYTWTSDTNWNYFSSGDSYAYGEHSAYVGRETPSGTVLNRTGMVSFTTPNVPIGQISFKCSGPENGQQYQPYIWENTGGCPLCWTISESPTSHWYADGPTFGYMGTLTVDVNNKYIASAATVNVNLKPNTTYYLWIYPNTNTLGYGGYILMSDGAKVTFTGEAGGTVWVHDGSNWRRAIPWVCDGGNWRRAIPWICEGTNWRQVGG